MKKKRIIILAIVAALSVVLAVIYGISRNTSPEYPEIKFSDGEISVSVNATDEELLEGVSATDPEDGDITDSLVVEGISSLIKGNDIKVTYAAVDSENHVTKASRTVKFVDYESPRFSLSAPLIFRLSNNINIFSNVGAEDVFDGDISNSLKYSISNDVSFDTIGEYEIKFSVTNKIGDTVTLPVTLEITDEDPRTEDIELSDYLVYLNKGEKFNAKDYVVSYLANGVEHNSANGLKITDNVNTDEAGVYTVDYIYSGRTACRTSLIVVVE